MRRTYTLTSLRNWKILTLIVCYAFLLEGIFGCASISLFSPKGKKYSYTYSLTEPNVGKALLFKDRNVQIQFSIDDATIMYQVKNLTDDIINVKSDGASIGINEKYSPVRNSISYYSDDSKNISPILVGKQGMVRDILIPRSNISYSNGRWIERPFFPTADKDSSRLRQEIQKTVGSTLTLILPILLKQNTEEYQFRFTVIGVKNVLWDSVTAPVGRPPMPPLKRRSIQNFDQWTSVAIAGGILGLSIILVSLKKKAPGQLD